MNRRPGARLRAVRIRRGWRQEDLARRARVSRATISRIERGLLEGVSFGALVRTADALDVRLEIVVRWQGGDLDRLMDAGHAALSERVAARLDALPGWVFFPETSFAIHGERGSIDILAWHPSTRSLVVIEVKTEIADLQEMLGTVDRKRRLARRIAADRGWHALTVSTSLVVAEGSTNRRRLANHRALLRGAFPADGHALRSWLNDPHGSIAAMSFWSDDAVGSVRQRLPTVRRVRRPRRPVSTHGEGGRGVA